MDPGNYTAGTLGCGSAGMYLEKDESFESKLNNMTTISHVAPKVLSALKYYKQLGANRKEIIMQVLNAVANKISPVDLHKLEALLNHSKDI